MEQALNGAWAWNGEKPVPQTAFQRPPDITEQSVCRFTGMRPGRCGRTQVMPFLSDFPPPVDNITPRGCIDLPLHEELNGRPQQWVEAARTWANRLASGNLGARGDPERENVRPDQVQFRIAPLYGERGWGPICGVRTQRVGGSRSSPSPAPSGSPAASPQATPAPSP